MAEKLERSIHGLPAGGPAWEAYGIEHLSEDMEAKLYASMEQAALLLGGGNAPVSKIGVTIMAPDRMHFYWHTSDGRWRGVPGAAESVFGMHAVILAFVHGATSK